MPYLILTSVISIGVALLALQNGAPTALNFIFWKFEVPLICVILGSFLAGAVVSSVFVMYSKFRHLLTDYYNNKEIKRLNKEVDSLKNNIALLTEPVKTMNIPKDSVKVEDAQTLTPETVKEEETQPVAIEVKPTETGKSN